MSSSVDQQISDDASLADAPKATASDLSIERAIDRTGSQLAFMHEKLAPWGVARELAGAEAFVARRRSEYTADRKQAERFAAAMSAQERVLQAASCSLGEVLDDVVAKGLGPKDAASIAPVVEVFRAFSRAAGTSHIAGAASSALAKARHLRRMLPLALAEDKLRTVPLVAYVQMQQLKVFGIAPGSLKHVRMDTVVNVVTAVQVEIAARRLGVDPTKLPSNEVAKTHTAEYAETPLVQSGHKMQNARISGGDRSMQFGEVLRMMRSEGYGPAADKAERLMAEHGILPTDKLLVGFNIDADLGPSQ